MTEVDISQFSEEPIEFLRRSDHSHQDTKASMIELVSTILKVEPRYLGQFLQFCVTNLHQYAVQQSEADWRIKESIIHMIGQLSEKIRVDYQGMIEGMMMEHVLPETQSPHLLLKYRALWFYGQFSGFKFQNIPHLHQILDTLFQTMYSNELALKVVAFKTLYRVLQGNEEAQIFLRPGLSDLLAIYLKIMDEYDSEEFIVGLEQLISYYKEDIEPFALSLISQMVGTYQRLKQQQTGQQELQGDFLCAAESCLNTVSKLIRACKHNRELLLTIEGVMHPILLDIIASPDSIDHGLTCLTLFLYYGGNTQSSERVSGELWGLYPQLIFAVIGDGRPESAYATDEFLKIGLAIKNYISRGPQTFLSTAANSTQTHLDMTLNLIEQVLVIAKPRKETTFCYVAMNIFITLLENLAGQIDSVVPYII